MTQRANLPFDPCAGNPMANVNWQQLYRQRSNIPLDENCVPDGLFNFAAWILLGVPDEGIFAALSDATLQEINDREWTWDVEDWWYSPFAFGSMSAYVDPEPEPGDPVLPEADEIFADFIWDDWFLAGGINTPNTTEITLESFESFGGRAIYVVASDDAPTISVISGAPEYTLLVQGTTHGKTLTIVQHDSTGNSAVEGEWSDLRFSWSQTQSQVFAQCWTSNFPFEDGPDGLVEDAVYYGTPKSKYEAEVGNVQLAWNAVEEPPQQRLDWNLGCLLLRGEQRPEHRQYWVDVDGADPSSEAQLRKCIGVLKYDLAWWEQEILVPESGPCWTAEEPATGPASAVISSTQDIEILLTQELSGDDIEDESWVQPVCGEVFPFTHGFHALLIVYRFTGLNPNIEVINSFSGVSIASDAKAVLRANEDIEELDIEVGADSFIEAFWNGNSVPDETYHVSMGASVSFNPDRRDAVVWDLEEWRGDDPDIVTELSVNEDRLHSSGAAFVPFMSATHESHFIVRLRLVTP